MIFFLRLSLHKSIILLYWGNLERVIDILWRPFSEIKKETVFEFHNWNYWYKNKLQIPYIKALFVAEIKN